MPEWAVYLQAAATVASLLLAAGAYWRSGRRADAVMVREAKEAAEHLEHRLSDMESTLSHLPPVARVHDIELSMSELRGQIGRMSERIGGLESTVSADLAHIRDLVGKVERQADRMIAFHLRETDR